MQGSITHYVTEGIDSLQGSLPLCKNRRASRHLCHYFCLFIVHSNRKFVLVIAILLAGGKYMSQTVGEVLVDQLVKAGVKRIYGIVGDSLNPITDAVRRNGNIRWITVRHEETGAFAAGAEAQLDGHLAVCAGSAGPGNLHLINGLFDAHRSMAPVLGIAAQIPSGEIGTGYFQETHPDRLFQECSHYCELISQPKQMPRTLQAAMQWALGRKGVSVVAIPGDIAAMPIPEGNPSHPIKLEYPTIRPDETAVARLADMLNEATKVTLFCGSGCKGAHEEVLKLAELLKAPVGHALRGKHYIEYDNPYDVGMSGLIGGRGAYDAMHNCDMLLLLGTNFPYEAFMPNNVKIAQVDTRAEHLGLRSNLDLGLWGDVHETINVLLPMLKPKSDRSHLDTSLQSYEDTRRRWNAYVQRPGKQGAIHPEFVADVLNELASADAIFTADTGMCTVWASRYIRATQNRRIIGSFMHGSMANALPQAIGAQFLYPDRQVIAMCGDGGFSMLMGDILTLRQYNLPIKLVIFNNGALDMVKLEMQVAGYPDYETDLKNPNFAKMAEALDIMGVHVNDPADVRSGLQRVLNHSGPALINIITDPHALAMPPHVNTDQFKGFALAMGKMVLDNRAGEVADIIEANVFNVV
jgi:pyruvate dehydrogenase (quinone)